MLQPIAAAIATTIPTTTTSKKGNNSNNNDNTVDNHHNEECSMTSVYKISFFSFGRLKTFQMVFKNYLVFVKDNDDLFKEQLNEAKLTDGETERGVDMWWWIGRERDGSPPQPVWPDWAMFVTSWRHLLLTKVAQKFCNFLGYFESITVYEKVWCAYFFGQPCKVLGSFYSNIWSHSSPLPQQYSISVNVDSLKPQDGSMRFRL